MPCASNSRRFQGACRPLRAGKSLLTRTRAKHEHLTRRDHGTRPQATAGLAHTIVVGNEKGGAGKSTVAMHLSIALLRMGMKVGVMDLDVRQRSLARYLENRARWIRNTGAPLPMPEMVRIDASQARDLDAAEKEEAKHFADSLKRLSEIVQLHRHRRPGRRHLPVAHVAHSSADTLITPLNDSFVDFDLLGDVDPQTLRSGAAQLLCRTGLGLPQEEGAGEPQADRLGGDAQPHVAARRQEQAARGRGARQPLPPHRLPHRAGPESSA